MMAIKGFEKMEISENATKLFKELRQINLQIKTNTSVYNMLELYTTHTDTGTIKVM